jgi:predicted DNA-binding transcriptional regulator AlpA
MKAKQSSKIKEIGKALVAAGFCALDEEAEALGLSRSTTWNILKGNHKKSGISAATLNRILSAPQLPPIVRAKIHEYIEEKIVGLYGDSKTRLRKFTTTLHSTSTKHGQ